MPAYQDYSHLDSTIVSDEYISPLYEIAKTKNRTVIDFTAFDIASNFHRVVTVAHPLWIDGTVEGVAFWEYDLENFFNNVMIPESFFITKTPFIQFRTPQHFQQEFDEVNEE